MNTSRERDQSIERLLRQSHKASHADASDSCLDAETLAAWFDGGLSDAALEIAQTHVSDCARCQALVGAMARADGVVPQTEDQPAMRRWLGWLVPLTAVAAAIALWVALPRDLRTPPPAPPRPVESRQEAADTKAQEEAGSPANQPRASIASREKASTSIATNNAEPKVPTPELRKDIGQLEADGQKQEQAGAAPAAEAPVAARSANVLAAEARTAGVEIVSPDTSVRWRIAGAVVEHSTNSGATWAAVPTGVVTALTAGAAPSTSVCWIVGRDGVVLLLADGRNWRRVAFPEITDLSSVRATDARTASVGTADGRMFSTSDGGLTWDQR